MTDVHLVLPAGYADPRRPSGGNRYDEQVVSGLTGLGWTVVVHEIPQSWPAPATGVDGAVAKALTGIPDDAVVVVDGLLATAGGEALLGQATRLRLVGLVHMPEPPGGPPGPVLRAMRQIVVTSQWTGRVLVEQHGLATDTVAVATPGVQAAELSRGSSTSASLLCVASVTPTKGHDVLFAALATLAELSWQCTCVGALDVDQAFADRLERDLVVNGIADRVGFTGPLSGPDLAAVWAAADLLVLASRHEGYGMVVTEAQARGVPVVATAVGGVPEALGRDPDGRPVGVLVPPEDPDALAAAISRWLRDEDLREDLRALTRGRRATLAGWEQPVTTISAVLRRVATI